MDKAKDELSADTDDTAKQEAVTKAEKKAVDAETAAEKARLALEEYDSGLRETAVTSMVCNSGDKEEETRQKDVADARLTACLAEHQNNPFMLPASGSMLGMLAERVANKDRLLACQLDSILHTESFQQLEAVWQGLHYLVFTTETGERLKLRLFNASFQELRADLERAVEFDQSLLFKRVYEEEYGTFGGEPYSCLLHVHEYGLSAVDLGVLQKMAEVAAAHTPLLSAASSQLFGLGSFTSLPLPRDLHKLFQSTDYIEWRAFREKEDARYVTLCLPHILLRLPYGNDTDPVESFAYEEDVAGPSPERYLWGNAAFALAGCITSAFAKYGWTAAIRGYEGGGAVEGLKVYLRSASPTAAKRSFRILGSSP